MTEPLLTQGSLLGGAGAPVYRGRDPLDRYYSPPIWADVLVSELGVRSPLSILEPCAGRPLALARRLAELGHEVTTADLDAGADVDHHRCVFTHPWPARSFDAVITNPPYRVEQGGAERHAADAVRRMLPVARQFVAMALRLSFAEPCANREDLLAGPHRPAMIINLPRHKFVGGGGTVSVSWFVWDVRSTSSRRPTHTDTRWVTRAQLAEFRARAKRQRRSDEEE